jgi:hypothetical protein
MRQSGSFTVDTVQGELIFGSAAKRRQPRRWLAWDRDTVPDEVVAIRPLSCGAWRNFVSAFGENGAVGVFCGQGPDPGRGVDDDTPRHRSNRHRLYRRIFLLAPRHNVQHPIRQRSLQFRRRRLKRPACSAPEKASADGRVKPSRDPLKSAQFRELTTDSPRARKEFRHANYVEEAAALTS